MKYSTIRYEPPEIVLEKSSPFGGRSRRQDIWSIGCVTLEFIIWLLYGYASLNVFNNKYVVDSMEQLCPYFEIEVKSPESKQAKLHPAVEETMDLLSKDQECRAGVKSAIKDLLAIVRTKLLVVNLNTRSAARATARELRLALQEIVEKGKENENYWYTGLNRSDDLRLPNLRSSGPSLLSPGSALGAGAASAPRFTHTSSEELTLVVPSVTQARKNEYRNAANIDITNFPVDNKFAREIVKTISTKELFPKSTEPTKRCNRCQKMNFHESRFTIRDSWTDLERDSETCDFCKLRWEASKHLRTEYATTVTFTREESMLKANEGRIPVMSLCRDPGMSHI